MATPRERRRPADGRPPTRAPTTAATLTATRTTVTAARRAIIARQAVALGYVWTTARLALGWVCC
ncbi:hypothetical protein J5X84_35440 [Streptosporangiaceae bacterium NEAU-GS5]|nr:hypothetical protein [Streptosporangiaceae bacterium NEAU-GS5]